MMEKLPCFQENAAVFSRFEINTRGTGCTEKEQLSGGEKMIKIRRVLEHLEENGQIFVLSWKMMVYF